MNGEFYNSFSSEEQGRIVETTITNDGESDTTDNIFLLSVEEAESYFPDSSARMASDNSGSAISWWLRTRGAYGDMASVVWMDGGIFAIGVVIQTHSVRPAMWINQ